MIVKTALAVIPCRNCAGTGQKGLFQGWQRGCQDCHGSGSLAVDFAACTVQVTT